MTKKDTYTYQHVPVDILCLDGHFRIKKISYSVDLQSETVYRIYINGEFLLEKDIPYTLSSIIDIDQLLIIKSYNNYIAFTPSRKIASKFIAREYDENVIIKCHDEKQWILNYSLQKDDYYAIMHKILTNIAFIYLLESGRIAEIE